MNITTPAILFPAISLLFLAYTSRFLALGSLIRQLNSSNLKKERISLQVKNLRKRIELVKNMQILGVLSFIFCSGSMFLIYINFNDLGVILFGFSMILLTLSLVFSLWEVIISTKAIKIDLDFMEDKNIV